MTEKEIRFECLKMAERNYEKTKGDKTLIELAELFCEFVFSEKESEDNRLFKE
ncbi:hypothetical protein [Mucilaginibacter paludis]|uniref:Uncharacterized protein n=1 Tax=Mucilaginibacter paludis DSM 18603 TaxID=714943 RepID=H1Y6J9_9SPHI|nr:hypothetical protein [Mucilaginibacter paludis]EHQ25843.1 hypothetical protein Mucpa_1688 [Mucilaginibacter paludis DSM 18603]